MAQEKIVSSKESIIEQSKKHK